MRAASFGHSLLSFDVDVCMRMDGYICISETKGDSGLFPMENYRKVPRGSRMVTLSMTSRDPMTS